MLFDRDDDRYIIRFEDGEAFPEHFLDFLAAHSIEGASFTGLGAFQRSRIAFFDVQARQYCDIELDEQLEVLSLVGNVAVHDQALLVHAHVTLGRRDGTTLGGHLRQGIVRPTLEVSLQALSTALHRAKDPKYGLPSLDLKSRHP